MSTPAEHAVLRDTRAIGGRLKPKTVSKPVFTLAPTFARELIHPRSTGRILRVVRPRDQGAHMSSMCVVAAGASSSVHVLPRIGFHAISCPCGNPRVPGKSGERTGDLLGRATAAVFGQRHRRSWRWVPGRMRSPGTTNPETGATASEGPGHRTRNAGWRCRTKREVQSGMAALHLICREARLRAATPRRRKPVRTTPWM